MTHEEDIVEGELEDLKIEIERFTKEKERVRAIVGRIGGIPTFSTTAFNAFFAAVIVGCLAVSLVYGGVLQLAMIELAVAAVSLKIMYLMHKQARVNQFQLWILSALEWRLDQLTKMQRSREDSRRAT